jgi:hypothetical protein
MLKSLNAARKGMITLTLNTLDHQTHFYYLNLGGEKCTGIDSFWF